MIKKRFLLSVAKTLSETGKKHRNLSPLNQVEPFMHYFEPGGAIRYDELDRYDGKFTRREILARYLLLNAVLDQGPDISGVRELLKNVTGVLYRREIRFLHTPAEFFREIGVSIDEILSRHDSIRSIRAEDWARENESSPSKYNLFFAQSVRGIVSTKQVLDYAIHRWGVPLCLPLLLEKELERQGAESGQPLVDYLERWPSAETMCQRLKDHQRYGLGSAIGDKACHVFAKMYVSSFKLVKHRSEDAGWTGFSYELPFDSNAGRVLFRTGFLLELASLKDYEEWNVIQKGKGKGGTHYLRVTNIRGRKTRKITDDRELFSLYVELVRSHFKRGRPRAIDIQCLPNLLIYDLVRAGHDYSVADFDDGLIHVGTSYCLNHAEPRCSECPLKGLCRAYNKEGELIGNYRT